MILISKKLSNQKKNNFLKINSNITNISENNLFFPKIPLDEYKIQNLNEKKSYNLKSSNLFSSNEKNNINYIDELELSFAEESQNKNNNFDFNKHTNTHNLVNLSYSPNNASKVNSVILQKPENFNNIILNKENNFNLNPSNLKNSKQSINNLNISNLPENINSKDSINTKNFNNKFSTIDKNNFAFYLSKRNKNYNPLQEIFSQEKNKNLSDSENDDKITLPFTPIFSELENSKKKDSINPTSINNINSHITDELEKMLSIHSEQNNIFESLAYRRAISQLKNAGEKITNNKQLKKYKYLGKSIKSKITEILISGKIKKVEILQNDEKNSVIKLLKNVYGIGYQFANVLYLKGIKTIGELRKNESILNNTQKIGLKYYEDLLLKIPRLECEEIYQIIKQELNNISPGKKFNLEICGSYRRGKDNIGDIDILITRQDNECIKNILSSLIEKLSEINLMTEILSISKDSENNLIEVKKSHFMGICKLKENPCRRIDIKVYCRQAYPFALLYFTGSAYFNRSMRLYAKKNNFGLNDTGLRRINANLSEENNLMGLDVKCENEEEIFAALGLEYVEPKERNI